MVSLNERIKLANLIEEWNRKTGTQAFDPFEQLGVSHDVSEDGLKKAYRLQSRIHHPDLNGGNDERYKKITHAYDILTKERDLEKAMSDLKNKISKWDAGNGRIYDRSENHRESQGWDGWFHGGEERAREWEEEANRREKQQEEVAKKRHKSKEKERQRREKLFEGYLGGILRDVLKRKNGRPMEAWEAELWNKDSGSSSYVPKPRDGKKRITIYPEMSPREGGWVMNANVTRVHEIEGAFSTLHVHQGDLIRDLHRRGALDFSELSFWAGSKFIKLLESLGVDKDAVAFSILPEWKKRKPEEKIKEKVRERSSALPFPSQRAFVPSMDRRPKRNIIDK